MRPTGRGGHGLFKSEAGIAREAHPLHRPVSHPHASRACGGSRPLFWHETHSGSVSSSVITMSSLPNLQPFFEGLFHFDTK